MSAVAAVVCQICCYCGAPGVNSKSTGRANPAASQGRLIDHLRNTQLVGLEDLQALVLDEADRLLSMGFTDEVCNVLFNNLAGRRALALSQQHQLPQAPLWGLGPTAVTAAQADVSCTSLLCLACPGASPYKQVGPFARAMCMPCRCSRLWKWRRGNGRPCCSARP